MGASRTTKLRHAKAAAVLAMRNAWLARLQAAFVSSGAALAVNQLTSREGELQDEIRCLAETGLPPLPSLCSETNWDLRRGDCWEPLLVTPGGKALAAVPWPGLTTAPGLLGHAVQANVLSHLHGMHGNVAGHPAGSLPGHALRPLLRRDLSLVEAKHVQDEIRSEVEDLIAGRRRSMGLSPGVVQTMATKRGERALLEALLLARAVVESFEPGSIDRHLAARRTDALLELLRSGVRKGEREAMAVTTGGDQTAGKASSSGAAQSRSGSANSGAPARRLRTYVQTWQTALSHPGEVRRVIENSLEGPPTVLLTEPNCQILVSATLEQIATGLLRTNVAIMAVYARS